MPADVFTRGFIKLYAQYLGLDPNVVVKLYTRQENLDSERPDEQPYGRDILSGDSIAHPLSLFKSNPRVRIVTILLAALICFYALGVIFKVLQKHPERATQENELAKSLVDTNSQPLPGPPGGSPTVTEVAGPSDLAGTPAMPTTRPDELSGYRAAAAPAAPYQAAPKVDRQPAPNQENSTVPDAIPRGELKAPGPGGVAGANGR